MRIPHRILALALLTAVCALSPSVSFAGHYEKLFAEEEAQVGEKLLETGAMPFPFPSRRQIIDADKGSACLACHRMPYPTAPEKAAEEGKMALSRIPITHPGAWRLMTPTPHPFNKRDGAYSPDGTLIAYTVNPLRQDWDIWTMAADGSNRRPLITGPTKDRAPEWSPDGRKVSYVSNETDNWEIWVVDVETLERRHLTPDSGGNFVPRWRADGKGILYVGWRGGEYAIKGGFDVARMRPDGSGKQELAPSPHDEMSARWSPDGRQVVFWS